jgi:hypothetical protein
VKKQKERPRPQVRAASEKEIAPRSGVLGARLDSQIIRRGILDKSSRVKKAEDVLGASIGGDLAELEAGEGSFRGNRQNVFERGVAHAERVVLPPSPANRSA